MLTQVYGNLLLLPLVCVVTSQYQLIFILLTVLLDIFEAMAGMN